jgi:hypothetical protein
MYEHMFAFGRTSCKEVVELGEHLVRFFEDVAPGVAAQDSATAARLPLALAVLLPRVTRPVELVRVELDREPVLRLPTVDKVSPGRPVRDRQRQTRPAQPSAKATLEPAQQDRRVTLEDGPETLRGVSTG